MDESRLVQGQLVHPTEKYARVGGLNIYYEENGVGDPLVLLHGGTVDAKQMWEKQIQTLRERYRVIAPDSRGHGKTNNPAGEITYRLMADDIAGFVKALNLGKPAICGYSDGGQVCLEIGMNHPDLARCLIVGAASSHLSDKFFESMRQAGIKSPGVVDHEQLEKARPQLVSTLRQVSSLYGPDYWKTYVTNMSKAWLTPLNYRLEDYAKITVPTLILLGDRDTGTSLEDALEMYRNIPRSELAVLPGADHYLVWSKPDMFNSFVLDFVQRSR